LSKKIYNNEAIVFVLLTAYIRQLADVFLLSKIKKSATRHKMQAWSGLWRIKFY
jgi:hypothetical protein